MRIVSLCPSITESLVALGLGGSLVGVTRYCVHPREALEGIPRVGGTKNPDLAAIAALEPDLVFCNAEENRAADVAELSRRHRVDVSHPTRVTQVPPLLRRLGELTGTGDAAEGWARALHIHPDGSADVVRQRLPALNRGMVWISRTPDQDALGFEPATAQVEGYSAEKRKGNLRILAPGEVFTGQMQAGYLSPGEVQVELKQIEAQLNPSGKSQ